MNQRQSRNIYGQRRMGGHRDIDYGNDYNADPMGYGSQRQNMPYGTEGYGRPYPQRTMSGYGSQHPYPGQRPYDSFYTESYEDYRPMLHSRERFTPRENERMHDRSRNIERDWQELNRWADDVRSRGGEGPRSTSGDPYALGRIDYNNYGGGSSWDRGQTRSGSEDERMRSRNYQNDRYEEGEGITGFHHDDGYGGGYSQVGGFAEGNYPFGSGEFRHYDINPHAGGREAQNRRTMDSQQRRDRPYTRNSEWDS